jgi:hypothetical protein
MHIMTSRNTIPRSIAIRDRMEEILQGSKNAGINLENATPAEKNGVKH